MDREKLIQLNEELQHKTLEFEKGVRQLKDEIAELKSTCTHTRFVYSYGGNTGNYDPSSDCYWINIHCLDCGMKSSFYDDDNEQVYKSWCRRKYDKDVELALSEEEYKLIKGKGLL